MTILLRRRKHYTRKPHVWMHIFYHSIFIKIHKKGGQVSNQMTDLDKDLACWANPCATLLPHRGTTRKQAFPESSSLK